jgi:thiol-disulfide isomerase/thioredoxin
MKRLLLLMALPWFLLMQSAVAQVRALTVGDKFPDIEFDNLIRYPKNKLKISDFKGKLVILDFWSTACGECIIGMPKMGGLQRQFGDQIKILPIWSTSGKLNRDILSEWVKRVDSAWNHNPYLYKASGLPTILDTVLYPYVKHLPGVAFQIWIDELGTIIAITDSEYVNEKEIAKVLIGHRPNWRIFKKIEYDYSKPLINIDSIFELGRRHFYSIIRKHKDYIQPRNILEIDSTKGTKRYLGINLPILNFYNQCYNRIYNKVLYSSQFIVETRDSARFFQLDKYGLEWLATHTYSIEKIAPVNMSDTLFYSSMKQELDNFFGIHSSIEKRNVNCLVLKRTSSDNKKVISNQSKQGSVKELLANLNNEVLSGKKLIVADKLLQNELEQLTDFPTMSTYEDYKSLDKINLVLKKIGLRLEESIQLVPVIVIKDLNSK